MFRVSDTRYWNHDLFLCCLLLFAPGAMSLDSSEFQKNIPEKVVWGVPGKDVELPCDVTPPTPNDNVTMVFWFKDTKGMPLYSLDARGGRLSEASHLAMSDDLGSRSYFIANEEPSKARLKINRVNIHDQGIFRCRVDFVNSPTRNFQVNLTLIEQPSVPRVFDAEGREIKPNATAGPFLEDDELFLSCQVNGGRPRPTLTWWFNGTLLDGVVDTERHASPIVNQLLIPRLPRKFKGAKLQCRAASSDLTSDTIREVPIAVFLKPSKVKIVTPNELMSNRKTETIKCETSGSYPSAKLTWLMDGKSIKKAIVTEEETDTFTASILTMSVTPEDDGKELVCRADNPRFPGGSKEDRRQIHVAYAPKVTVKMDSEVTLPVKEGSSITLRCEATARPSPHSYSWYHNGHLIAYNESGGILPIDQLLTLRSIERKSSGQYACSALNSEGETYSAPFDLPVEFPPHCRKGYNKIRVGFVPSKPLVVRCLVDSIPPVTRFSWTYNTSKGVLPVQGAKMQNKGSESTLHFTPATDDLESLACWATNDVGRQETPCLFYIVPADVPETPKHCFVRNASHGGLEVTCKAGKDGGLHQTFFLEVSDITIPAESAGVTTMSDQGENARPIYRVMGEQEPEFRLHSLRPGRDYQLSVYAENARGTSPMETLPTLKIPADSTSASETGTTKQQGQGDRETPQTNLTLILVALAASAILLITGIVVVAAVLACRRTPSVVRRRHAKPPEDFELNSEEGFGEGFHRRSAQYRASMYALDVEDRISRLIEGPDLIQAPGSLHAQNSDF